MQVTLYNPNEKILISGGLELVSEWQQAEDTLLWVRLGENVSDEDQSILKDVFSIHPLAISDALQDRHPPKLEPFEEHVFILFRGLASDPEQFELKTITISLFVGQRFLVSRSSGPSASLDKLHEEIESAPDLIKRGPDALAIRLSRIMVDRYLRTLLKLENRMEEIEQEMLDDPSDVVLAELIGYKTELTKFRRIFHYHVQILKSLGDRSYPGFSPENEPYRVDSFEQQERALSLATLYYDMASNLIDGYISVASHRLNNIMKVLTIVSVIFVPLSFLVGLYGMNFEYIPELSVPGAYFILLGVMAGIVVSLLYFFRKKKWL